MDTPKTEIRKADLSITYIENGKFCIDEQLYPESRGHVQHKFDTDDEAEKFIEAAK